MVMTVREMKELNGECCQRMCSELGTQKVYWPNDKPKLMCDKHAAQSKVIGNAMGIHIPTEPIKILE